MVPSMSESKLLARDGANDGRPRRRSLENICRIRRCLNRLSLPKSYQAASYWRLVQYIRADVTSKASISDEKSSGPRSDETDADIKDRVLS